MRSSSPTVAVTATTADVAPPQPEPTPDVAVAAAAPKDAAPEAAPEVAVADAVVVPEAGPEASAEEVVQVAKRPVKKTTRKGSSKTGAGTATKKVANEKAAALLKQAKAALASRNAGQAEHLARKSYQEQKSSAAVEVVAKAKCMAKQAASAAGWARRLSKRKQKAMIKYCKKHHVALPL